MAEVNWQVPDKWQIGPDLATWAPIFKHSFEGPSGSPDIHGPSNAMSELCIISYSISSIFFLLFPISLFDYIARMSQKCAFKDWVTAVDVIDHDGKVGKKTRFQPCHQNDPNKRYRAPKASVNFATGYIIC